MKILQKHVLIIILSICTFVLSAQIKDQTKEEPLIEVEQMPQFPGGDEALLNFIKENLKYPEQAAKAGIEGRVTVRFVVGVDGNVRDVVVIRGLDSLCNQEAVRVVKLMPTWTPGKLSGKKVPIYYTLPIVYKLEKTQNNTPLLIVDGLFKPYSMMKDSLMLKPSNIESVTVLKDSAATSIYGIRGKNGVILIRTKAFVAKMDSAIKEDKPVYGVEVMPQFPGGDDALMEFIKNNLRYPMADAGKGIEGRTTIRFVINKTGKITDVTVVRGLSPACDAEAVRVIRLMPDWTPGSQFGKPVSVYYTLPIVYKLKR